MVTISRPDAVGVRTVRMPVTYPCPMPTDRIPPRAYVVRAIGALAAWRSAKQLAAGIFAAATPVY